MIRIIGTDDKHIHKITCKTCASIIEYTKDEVKSFTHRDYGGGSDTYYHIVCPKCDEEVYVKN